MSGPVIETPRGKIFLTKNGKAKLEWNTNFRPRWQHRYSMAQKFIDNEVLKDCDKLVPFRTGMLRLSGILGTEVGSGLVQWIAPYSRYQYYLARRAKSEHGPQRGSFWFERAKAVHKQRWIAGARKIAGGGRR